MRRVLALLVCAFAGLVSASSPANAKTPPFTVEVLSSGERSSGELSIRVVIDDPAETFDAPDMDGLLAAFPQSSVTDDLRPHIEVRNDGVAIPLRRVEPFTYEGTVGLPASDEAWVVVPFPTSIVAAKELLDGGYPPSMRVEAATDADDSEWTMVLVAGTTAVGAFVVVLRHWRRPVVVAQESP